VVVVMFRFAWVYVGAVLVWSRMSWCGRGSGVETLCRRELSQGVVRRWVFLWWLLWVIPCAGCICYSGPYLLSLTLVYVWVF
jgi:hypothetical protein